MVWVRRALQMLIYRAMCDFHGANQYGFYLDHTCQPAIEQSRSLFPVEQEN